MTAYADRQNGLDLGRVIAIVVVIMIHLPNPNWSVINFAVPYFFVLSGYLLSRRADAGKFEFSVLKKFVFRHWKLFGFWALVYSLIPPNWPYYAMHGGWADGFQNTLAASLSKFLMNPVNFLLDGPPYGFHLWYLACAPLAAGFVFMLARQKLQFIAILLAFACVGVLLLLKPEQRLGTDYWASNAKLGLLSAIPCICFGWFYALRHKADKHLLIGIVLFMVGMACALPDKNTAFNSVAGIILGSGLFVVLFAFPVLPFGGVWSMLGRMSLGVYLIHLALRPIVFFALPKIAWAPSWTGIALLTTLSFIATFLVSKIPIIKNQVL